MLLPDILPQEAGVQKKYCPTAVTIFMSRIIASGVKVLTSARSAETAYGVYNSAQHLAGYGLSTCQDPFRGV